MKWKLALCIFNLAIFSSAESLRHPTFSGRDHKRKRIAVVLEVWGKGRTQPTDIQFVPGNPKAAWVCEKSGTLYEMQPGKAARQILKLSVRTDSELGLLGVAFHPRFKQNRKFYTNWTPAEGARRTRISEWVLGSDYRGRDERTVIEIAQPYANHNAGQLQFGKDGMLYLGMGDGGHRDDPHGNGQDRRSLLGKMLRLDIDHPTLGKGYAVPSDNPFVNTPGYAPEVWALGLRNPWRYSWDTLGRLVVADVGQDAWEEISIVEKQGNYGWKTLEGSHCFPAGSTCKSEALRKPFLQYDRQDGVSITGGYVYEGAIRALQGKYVFGDFGSGRLWAVDLPPAGKENETVADFHALGMWPVQFSAFGKDEKGEVYAASFSTGDIYKICAP